MQSGRWINDQHVSSRCQKHAAQACKRNLLETFTKKHELAELTDGVWFGPDGAILKQKRNRFCTMNHAAQATSWVINGDWTQNIQKVMCKTHSKYCKCWRLRAVKFLECKKVGERSRRMPKTRERTSSGLKEINALTMSDAPSPFSSKANGTKMKKQ